MAKDVVGILSLVVAVIVSLDALVEFINNLTQGISNTWATMSPTVRLILVGFVIYLVSKRN